MTTIEKRLRNVLNILLASAVVLASAATHAEPILQLSWDIAGKNAAPNGVYTTYGQSFIKTPDPDVTGGLMGLGSPASAANVNNAYRANFSQTSLSNAISNNEYLSLFTSPVGTLSFQQLTLNLQTGTAATFTWNLFSDKTGFDPADVLQTQSNGNSSAIVTWTVDLTGVDSLQNVSTATEFRIYGFRDASGTSQAGFANQTGSHDVAIYAVPEPSTSALLGFGLLPACLLARRILRRVENQPQCSRRSSRLLHP